MKGVCTNFTLKNPFNPQLRINNKKAVKPEDNKILNKSKKVECLIIPAYVLKKNIPKILIPTTAAYFPKLGRFVIEKILVLESIKYVKNRDTIQIHTSITTTNQRGKQRNSVILIKLLPLYKAVNASLNLFIKTKCEVCYTTITPLLNIVEKSTNLQT